MSLALTAAQRPLVPPAPSDDALADEDGEGRILTEDGGAIPLESNTP